MDDFDNMSEFSPFTWQPVYSDGSSGELMDFNSAIGDQSHLSSSRGMLETIVEETSDDEENGLYSGNWSGSDSFSSGSSETGSVVRVDVTHDQDNQDAISERDFICPPKRRRQEVEQAKLDFIPTSSLFSQLLNPTANAENGIFDNYFMKQNDLRALMCIQNELSPMKINSDITDNDHDLTYFRLQLLSQ
ncbi:CLUMA_CG004697, isoform A [Clunio marinus]|uniref:CLUMA_CG004697, isoform A n=1 Tax=Clunio marinus TaxID=568069 RepID=A0A1J1HXY8_9DIPT|nr:CLUMA_CG004697, isoform A [Clunio marinus]